MTNCRRGDVVLVHFPNSNLQSYKRRPALVIQADNLGTGLHQTIIAMITSNLSRAGHSSRVVVHANTLSARQTGLLTDSVIMTDNLATVDHSEIDRILGTFQGMDEVDLALKSTLSL